MFVEIIVSKSGDLILKGLKGEVGNLNKKLKGTHDISRQLATGFKLLASTWALLKIKNFTKEWMNLYEEMEKADKLLDQAAANSGKYSRVWSLATRDMANAMQDLTGTHRATIEMGQRLLVTFDEITNEILPRATLAMVNYAAFTGVSMNSAAKAVGKSSMGLLGDLKRVGVQVDEVTYRTKGFIGILGQLEAQMGGQAETFRKTTAGQWMAWKNEIKDVRIELGEFFDMFIVDTGLLKALTKSLGEFADILKGMKGEDMARHFYEVAQSMLTMAAGLGHIIDMMITGWRILGIEKSPKGWELLLKGGRHGMAKMMEMLTKGSTYKGQEGWSEIWGEISEEELNDLNRIASALSKINSLETQRLGIREKILEISRILKPGRYDIDIINREIPEISIWTTIWEAFTQDITGIFQKGWVDSLTNMELDFTKFAKQLNAKMAQAFIQNIWDVKAFSIGGNLGYGVSGGKIGPAYGYGAGLIGPPEETKAGTQVNWGQLMSAVAVAYSVYKSENAIQGGITGAMAGGQMTGSPFGALAGGVMGIFAGLKTTEGAKRPSIDLLWEVIDGEVKLIAEQWTDTAKSQELVDTIQLSLQRQIDFVKQINFLIQDRYSELESVSSPITFTQSFGSGGMPTTDKEKIQWLYGYGGQDKGFDFENYNKLIEVFGQNLISSLEEAGTTGVNLFNELMGRFEELAGFVSDSMGNAFLDSLETRDYDTFKQTLKEGLYETTIQGLAQAFINRKLVSGFQGLFDVNAITTGISQFGEGNISADELVNIILTTFAGLPEVFKELKPVWEAFNTGMSGLQMALGINTEALYSNIEELRNYINTIQDTIHSLTVSDLAPALSQKVFAAEYERLLGGAGTQEGLDDFVRYIQSEYLPFMRDYATDYAGSFEKVIEDLRTLEEEPKDEIVDILTDIYENLGGSEDSLVNLLKELQLTGVHINEEDMSRLGLTVTNGIIEAGVKGTIAQVASGEAQTADPLPWQDPFHWDIRLVNGVLVYVDSFTGEVMGPMPT